MSDEQKRTPILRLPELKVEAKQPDHNFGRRVSDLINEKAVSPNDACPVCGSPNNTVTPDEYSVSVTASEGAVSSGRAMPVMATVCTNCGFVRFFSAIMLRELLGIVEPSQTIEPTSEGGDNAD